MKSYRLNAEPGVLKECPFCRGETLQVCFNGIEHFVLCTGAPEMLPGEVVRSTRRDDAPGCGACGPASTTSRTIAIEKWNSRGKIEVVEVLTRWETEKALGG